MARASNAARVLVGATVGLVSTDVVLASGKTDSGSNLSPITCKDGTSVMPWSAPTRSAQLKRLKEEKFDVVVVGGGCVGAGCAMEGATRGLNVALLDGDDFAAGTSGRSTKLIHGGIRYLEQAVFSADVTKLELVIEALAERAHLLNAAPFMAHPVPIMIPLYKWWELPYMYAGAKAYDIFAWGRRAVPASTLILKDEAMYRFPMLNPDGLKGAVVYYDGMHNDTRMNLLIALTAAQHGAAVSNHITVVGIKHDKEGKVCGVEVRDEQTGESWVIRARAVVNATGPFADTLRKMDAPEAKDRIVPAGGVHIILPDHCCPERHGLIVPKTRDGRVLFFLPWEGSTLCGTTDSETDLTMMPKPTEQEISFILEEANRFLNTKVSRHDVKAAWSGIRPLVRDFEAKDTKSFSRNHVVETSPSGMVSVMGGKWTTYRQMAEDGIDAVLKSHPRLAEMKPIRPSSTQRMQLLGADRAGIVVGQKFDRITITLREKYGMHKDVSEHLLRNYGTRALQVAELCEKDRTLRNRLSRRWPFIKGEIVFAMRQEYACTAVDVIARRLRLAFLDSDDARKALPTVLDAMQAEAGWSSARRSKEEAAALAFLATMNQVFDDESS
ncbi:hypothetical protein FNF27_05763 [Cafeteria roenbergensis]|uniref:glycerol-3-phosphate dehydrogenase n=1 Tax=Cafeteria roenbergensis TaxID=33653 RepID=A0A5A8DWV5_CAFRO|nr:hypothetical protein FNF31_05883 [Cafeteria roenbergensis]KAA0169973.1 hypothetical protein FNF28_01763 [Cafeteria roenbergensis]KAA0172783.1 hypothetical protein FNF27_05763 [Cafeteria roenbergensis]